SSSSETAATSRGFAVAVRGHDVLIGGYVTGRTRLAGLELDGDPLGDGFLVALDADTGTLRRGRLIGGVGSDSVNAIAVSPTGEIAIAGAFSKTAELVPGHPMTSAGNQDAFVALV